MASATGGRITAEAFLAASENASAYAADYAFLESAGENSLEGFLFPKTYAVTEDMDAEAVVRMMLDQFGTETASIFGDFANSYPASQGLTLYQAVNLASIVAKESTGDQEVRDHVAGVFYNRLASDRPYLESDATTAYEVGREPTAEEVHAETPYSTYANAGLPPTPICSPGPREPHRVCEPTQTEDMFFYFYPDADGNMQAAFSKTYEEHQQAIADNSNAGGALTGRAMLPALVKARPPKGAFWSSGATMALLTPDRYFSRISAIDIERDLLGCGLTHALLDIDNTVRARDTGCVPRDVGMWLGRAREARGELLFALEQLARRRVPVRPASWRCPSWPRP